MKDWFSGISKSVIKIITVVASVGVLIFILLHNFLPRFTPSASNATITSSEAIINNFNDVSRLVVFESDITHTTYINQSWSFIPRFIGGNYQYITFDANVTMSTDLNKMDINSIIWGRDGNIAVVVPEPVIEAININPDSTEFSQHRTGLLRRNNAFLSPQEFNEIVYGMQRAATFAVMRDKIDYAREFTISSTYNLIREILSTTEFSSSYITIVLG